MTAGRLPPGPTEPPEAQAKAFADDSGAVLERCAQQFGDAFTLRLGSDGTWVVLSHPDEARAVLRAPRDAFAAWRGSPRLRRLLGERSLLRLSGEEHLRERRLLLPAMHAAASPHLVERTRALAATEVGRWPEGQPAALHARLQAITVATLLPLVFGDRRAGDLAAVVADVQDVVDVHDPPRDPAASAAALARLEDTIAGETDRARAREDDGDDAAGSRSGVCVVGLLTSAIDGAGRPLDDRHVRDEAMTMLLAGQQSATTLAWACERLARHPEAQERFATEDDPDAWCDAVLYETMRLRPPTWMLGRELRRELEVGRWLLPAGVMASPCVLLINRRPDRYPEPLAFRPERFLDRGPDTYAWLSFGGGVRRCLGASLAMTTMRAVLAEILRTWRLTPAEEADEQPRHRGLAASPGDGARVVLTRRLPVATHTSRG